LRPDAPLPTTRRDLKPTAYGADPARGARVKQT